MKKDQMIYPLTFYTYNALLKEEQVE